MSRILFIHIVFATLILSGLSACSSSDGPATQKIKARGSLIIATTNSPFGVFEGSEQTEGFEYELAKAFATSLGVQLTVTTGDNPKAIFELLDAHKADLAAATLTVTEERQKSYLMGPVYIQSQEYLICRRGKALPTSLDALNDYRITISPDTSFIDSLEHLKQSHPELTWTIDTEADLETLLHQVNRRRLDCTITEDFLFNLYRRYFPGIRKSLAVSKKQGLAWMVRNTDDDLAHAIHEWFDEYKHTDNYADLLAKYSTLSEQYDYVDQRRFHRRIKHLLPKYQSWFKSAATKHDLSWTLLAAVSYQESHWNAKAKSPTGVRGIMMLTQTTAKSVGVKNRLDPKQNIFGGARYLARMLKRVPEHVADEDKMWFALAAYNIGMGHMHDAQILARELGKDPNQWVSLKEVLPLLSQKKYYKDLKYGYARGHEPVTYVDNIRNYQDILEKSLYFSAAQN